MKVFYHKMWKLFRNSTNGDNTDTLRALGDMVFIVKKEKIYLYDDNSTYHMQKAKEATINMPNHNIIEITYKTFKGYNFILS